MHVCCVARQLRSISIFHPGHDARPVNGSKKGVLLDVLCATRKTSKTGPGVVGQQRGNELLCAFIKLAGKVHHALVNFAKGFVGFRCIERCPSAGMTHIQRSGRDMRTTVVSLRSVYRVKSVCTCHVECAHVCPHAQPRTLSVRCSSGSARVRAHGCTQDSGSLQCTHTQPTAQISSPRGPTNRRPCRSDTDMRRT